MSRIWPDGTGPIYTGDDLNPRQERVNSFHYNSVTHPVEPGKCCTDTCEICAKKLCAPIICLYETCVLGGKCCTECIKKLKETGMNQDAVNEAKNTLEEIPPDGIKMTRGGRKTRRRKRKRRRKSTKKKRRRKRTKKKRKRRRRTRK